MSQIINNIGNTIHNSIEAALKQAIYDNKLPMTEKIPSFGVEISAELKNGDFSSNVALIGAKIFHQAPLKLAEIIKEYLQFEDNSIERIEVAKPGFLNFFLKLSTKTAVIGEIIQNKEKYGSSDFGKGKKINIEFVSANPTGPMHMGNARGGALGDCLSALMAFAGYDTTNEFYINDAGNQIDKFSLSLYLRYKQLFEGEDSVNLPEDCYQGEDIIDLARQFKDKFADKYLHCAESEARQALVNFALPININNMKKSLDKYRVKFDIWFKESDLHKGGAIQEILSLLKSRGRTYEEAGAVWYKPSDESLKSEVLIRENGLPTYFAADIAYHFNKISTRKFDKCIDIWGTDHHGHVARLKSALEDCGLESNKLDIILMQLVRLVRAGEVTKMSKRSGKALQLNDLLDEVSVDAARFLFNLKEANSQMDFDLDLAVKEDSNNPVYYVQYAHARICSILSKLRNDGIVPRECSVEELVLLNSDEELKLIQHLAVFSHEIVEAAKNYDPARITRYVITLATLFHKFYNANHVRCDDESLMQARLNLCQAVKIVLHNILKMFKISAPEKM